MTLCGKACGCSVPTRALPSLCRLPAGHTFDCSPETEAERSLRVALDDKAGAERRARHEVEKTQRRIDGYERERRAERSAEVADIAQRVWAQFASAATAGYMASDHEGSVELKTTARVASEVADLLLAHWKDRFGLPKEDEEC